VKLGPRVYPCPVCGARVRTTVLVVRLAPGLFGQAYDLAPLSVHAARHR
jgi:hypothetical protein